MLNINARRIIILHIRARNITSVCTSYTVQRYTTSSYRHVTSCADERMSHRIDQLARNAKVAEFNLTRAIDQDVARFYVPMHYGVLISQVSQTFQNL